MNNENQNVQVTPLPLTLPLCVDSSAWNDLCTEGPKEGRPAVSCGGGCSGVWGAWNGQDRLSSLPPVCCRWIGDYSSRCVIRSELYSWGCWLRRGVTGNIWEGMPHRNHISVVLNECTGCAKLFSYAPNDIHSLPSSFPHPHPPQLSFRGFARQESPWNKDIDVLMYASTYYVGNCFKCNT